MNDYVTMITNRQRVQEALRQAEQQALITEVRQATPRRPLWLRVRLPRLRRGADTLPQIAIAKK
ncbi:MAG: hypothetical protein SF123_10170 [Chloroflexota bacterium]|nr:hypothetical protein [Chloroflexota bacterium]